MIERSHWAINGEDVREPLHYPDCGLDNIYLLSGYEVVQTAYGDGVAIKNLDGLRRAIGFQLATRKKLLHGQEIRFLRKFYENSNQCVGAWVPNEWEPAVYPTLDVGYN